MSAPRAAWKGWIKLGKVACAVKLVNATSEAGSKVHFRILNRETKNPVKSAYIDEATGEIVETDEQVKGYELRKDEYLEIEPDEIKKLKLKSEHTLEVASFVPLEEIDRRYLDQPYHVIPADGAAEEAFAAIRAAMESKKVAARSCIVLYQRGREVVLQPYEDGMLMTTLRPHDFMVSEKGVFEGLKTKKLDPEYAELMGLIIKKKTTKFDPSDFEDKYEDALIAMIQAKLKGKKPPKPVPAPKTNVVHLADVLKKSLKREGIETPAKKTARSRGRKKAA
jgi:DNA end-binding protein Ku